MKRDWRDRVVVRCEFGMTNATIASMTDPAVRQAVIFQKREDERAILEAHEKFDGRVYDVQDSGWLRGNPTDRDVSTWTRTVSLYIKPTLWQRVQRLFGFKALAQP